MRMYVTEYPDTVTEYLDTYDYYITKAMYIKGSINTNFKPILS